MVDTASEVEGLRRGNSCWTGRERRLLGGGGPKGGQRGGVGVILKATNKHSRKGKVKTDSSYWLPFHLDSRTHPQGDHSQSFPSTSPPRDSLAPRVDACRYMELRLHRPCALSSTPPGTRPPSHLSGGVCRPGQPLHPRPRSARPGAAPASFQMDAPAPEITQRTVSDPLSLLFLGRPEALSAKSCIKLHFESGWGLLPEGPTALGQDA